jgi:hypothetical protein
LLTE